MEHEPSPIITPLEVSQVLRCNRDKVYRMLNSGEIPGRRVGRQWRISRRQLIEWLESR